jgi:hypothetical protein
MVHGAWCMVHGAWCMVRTPNNGESLYVPCDYLANIALLRKTHMVHGAWCMVHGAWYAHRIMVNHYMYHATI